MSGRRRPTYRGHSDERPRFDILAVADVATATAAATVPDAAGLQRPLSPFRISMRSASAVPPAVSESVATAAPGVLPRSDAGAGALPGLLTAPPDVMAQSYWKSEHVSVVLKSLAYGVERHIDRACESVIVAVSQRLTVEQRNDGTTRRTVGAYPGALRPDSASHRRRSLIFAAFAFAVVATSSRRLG